MLERFKVPEADRVYVSEDKIRAATNAIFLKMGLDEEGARVSTDVLIMNDLRGVETHGVSNMLRSYVAGYGSGALNPTPDIKTLRESSTTATWDGDRGLGAHIGPIAMQLAMDKAEKHGQGAVSVTNTGHLAGAGYHAAMAAEQDMIGMAMTGRGGVQAVPTFGAEPRFGTNPIAYAVPARKMPPFLFDVATTQVAGNKIRLARRVGAGLIPNWVAGPDGTVIDKETDGIPDEYFMLPFGGTRENGSHKGYAFAAVVDVMTGQLSGAGPGFIQQKTAHYFQAWKIDAFMDTEKFKDDMDDFLEGLANTKPAPGQERVFYPGLSEFEETNKRKAEGIPYHREVIEWFGTAAAELGLDLDLE
jgi:LDH2 family malate/lactate/ureidoglycolate dehydrogenase